MEAHQAFRELIGSDALALALQTHLKKPRKVKLFEKAVHKLCVNGHIAFFASWSWWAFLLGPVYFVYRKLYKEAAFIFTVLLIGLFSESSVSVFIGCGLSAKYFYLKKFAADYFAALDSANKDEALGEAGGYNLLLAVAALVVVAALSLVAIGADYA